MRTELERRLAANRHRRYLEEAVPKLQALLRSIDGVTWCRFVEEGELLAEPWVLARPLFQLGLQPDSRLRDSASTAEQAQWVRECLGHLGFAKRYYLVLGGDYAGLPWSVVEVPMDGEWFPALCLRAGMRDALVLSSDQMRFLYVSEEPDDWAEYVCPVVSLLSEAWALAGDASLAHCPVGRPLFYGDSEWR